MQGHPSSVDAYIRHGWHLVPIPPGTKGPNAKGWNTKEFKLRSSLDLAPLYGIGLCHAYSSTMSLDVDNWDMAEAAFKKEGIDLGQLFKEKDAVSIESGRRGHAKLLYAMPFGLVLPSKKLIHIRSDGSRDNYLEFRCATSKGLTVQDVLPPTIHPDTQQPYRWGGAGHWSRLPLLPPELLGFWNRLIEKDKERNISSGTEIDSSWEDIESALSYIPPDIDRERWIAIGMAVHWAGSQSGNLDHALDVWDTWSAGTPEHPAVKYRGIEDLLASWRGFKPENGRTLGTLFHYAREGGWRRPVPSAREIFSQSYPTMDTTSPVDILAGFRPPPPAPDLSIWPSLLATRAQEVASGIGCDPLVTLFSGLAAVSGAADARIRLELVHGFRVPPVIWVMTIGKPADKKSPGSYPMIDPLRKIEDEHREEWKTVMLDWEVQEACYQEARKAYLEHYKDPLNRGPFPTNEVGPEVPNLGPMPVPVKIIVQDITSQKLVRRCAERPRGVLCFLDEMSAWARKTTDPRATDDRAAWTVSYESKYYEMDRVGTGTWSADNYAVTMYGNIQPKVIKKYVKSLSEDGLLQRFIPAILRPGHTWRGNPVPDEFTAKLEWENLLKQVFAIPEQVYYLHPDAARAFSDFQDFAIQLQRDERIIDSDDNYQTALGKITGTCGRLCLLFHLIESPLERMVSLDTMIRTIRVIKEYVIPSLRYTFGELCGHLSGVDEWVIAHIIQIAGDNVTITLADLRRGAEKLMPDTPLWQQFQLVRDSVSTLEKCNWLKCVEDQPSHNHVVWAVNPSLAHTYIEYRQQVMTVRERIMRENNLGRRRAQEAGFTGPLED